MLVIFFSILWHTYKGTLVLAYTYVDVLPLSFSLLLQSCLSNHSWTPFSFLHMLARRRHLPRTVLITLTNTVPLIYPSCQSVWICECTCPEVYFGFYFYATVYCTVAQMDNDIVCQCWSEVMAVLWRFQGFKKTNRKHSAIFGWIDKNKTSFETVKSLRLFVCLQ